MQYVKDPQRTLAQCLKSTQKVAFNIASEASYVYILNSEIGEKCKNWKIGMRHFEQFSNIVPT